jgi:hypothetical protein
LLIIGAICKWKTRKKFDKYSKWKICHN